MKAVDKMITKRCKDCGIIFQTYNPEDTRCPLCEDDRKEAEDADCDYMKNYHRLRIYRRAYKRVKPGALKKVYGFLLWLMEVTNEKVRGCDCGNC